MFDTESIRAFQDASDWSMLNKMALKASSHTSKHAAFSFTPVPIEEQRYKYLVGAVPILGKLIHGVSENREFLRNAIGPVSDGDPFFKALLKMHDQIYAESKAVPPRLPLLIMRSDFMDDVQSGPQLIEFNGIAAGMGPFGQKIHELHQYLKLSWPQVFDRWSSSTSDAFIDNPAIERIALGIAKASEQIRIESGNEGPATFLMIVQEDEDNIFDQHLLEEQLQHLGLKTIKRTFRQLHGNLSTGKNNRLILDGFGPVDTVYLRAGYQYSDYIANDFDETKCCAALMSTRIFIEQHRVAVNATVNQQLATSKRIQMLLSSMDVKALTQFGLTTEEARVVKQLMGEVRSVNKYSYDAIKNDSLTEWVLKNQGEGGGHCVFDQDILPALQNLEEQQYPAWSLMRRIHPQPRKKSALVIRDAKPSIVEDLISELGMFTVHIDGKPAVEEQGFAGYLIRSKSAAATEGGVHSGLGVLDSLIFK